MTGEPTRLSDPTSHASAGLRELLRSTVNDGPSSDQLQRLAARLGPQLGAAPSAPVSVKPAGLLARKLVAFVAVGVVTGVGGFLVGRVTVSDRRVALVEAKSEPPTPQRMPEPEPSSAPAVMPPKPTIQQPPSRRPAAPHIESTPPVEPTTSPPNETDDEISILTDAQRALVAGDARGALALTVTSAARFPQGTLVEEREALAIEALVALSRLDEARTRFDAFRAQFPRSTYRERLQRLTTTAPE